MMVKAWIHIICPRARSRGRSLVSQIPHPQLSVSGAFRSTYCFHEQWGQSEGVLLRYIIKNHTDLSGLPEAMRDLETDSICSLDLRGPMQKIWWGFSWMWNKLKKQLRCSHPTSSVFHPKYCLILGQSGLPWQITTVLCSYSLRLRVLVSQNPLSH